MGYEQFTPPVIVDNYVPVLMGATNNPSVTYGQQSGTYFIIGNLCYFTATIVSNSMTKTTLGDAMRISLPVPAAGTSDETQILNVKTSNVVAVQNASDAYTVPGQNYATLAQRSVAGLLTDLNYALLTGIGVLSTKITININGCYRIN